MNTHRKNQKISVLMPAYNSEKYIQEAIRSILRQSYKNIELIICNDGSTDNTLKTINEINDNRIVILNNPSNMGISFTRNLLLKAARGDLIAWLDADDICLEDRFIKQIDYINRYNIDVCAGCAIAFNDVGNIEKKIGVATTSFKDVPILMLFENVIINSSVMFKHEILDRIYHFNNLRFAEDYDFYLRCMLDYKILIVNDLFIKYRISDTQTTNNIKASEKRMIEESVLQSYLSSLDQRGISKLCDFFKSKHHNLQVRDIFKIWRLKGIYRKIFNIRKKQFDLLFMSIIKSHGTKVCKPRYFFSFPRYAIKKIKDKCKKIIGDMV